MIAAIIIDNISRMQLIVLIFIPILLNKKIINGTIVIDNTIERVKRSNELRVLFLKNTKLHTKPGRNKT